ncbi:MAG: urate hydroxylase PuuD [Qingshengfaniella sp.]
MIDIVFEWLGYLGRWGHVIAGITWIGTSFYFNWFDLSERAPQSPTIKPNVVGQIHEMHGGSFYYHERFWPTEDSPRTLAHSGPAQFTFLTGLFLIVSLYWFGASLYLTGPGGRDAPVSDLVVLSAAVIFGPWLIYDRACKMTEDDRIITLISALIVVGVSLIATRIFTSRAAFVHVGAALGTIMAANVHFVIVPNHIRMRRQVQAKQAVTRTFHLQAKRRSQHNNYFTLPVLFAMLSVHFPLVTTNGLAWITIPLICGSAGALRHWRNRFMVTEQRDGRFAVLAGVLMVAAIATSAVRPTAETQDMAGLSPRDAETFAILRQRCAVCHATTPVMDGFTSPPAGLRLETLAQAQARKDLIYSAAITNDIMPPGNLTEMTDAERAILADWLISVGAGHSE